MSYEDAYAKLIQNASDAAKEHAGETKGAAGSTDLFVAKQKKELKALKAEEAAMKSSTTAAKAFAIAKNALVSFGIGVAISLITKGIEYLTTASERAIEKTKELQEEISKISSDYESNRKTLEGLREEYDALTNKIGINGAEASLTADEYERYKDITSEILGITPQLITGWDDEGRAISNKNGLLQQSINLLDEEYQKSLRNSTTKAKNEELAKGIIAEKKEFDKTKDKNTQSGAAHKIVLDDFQKTLDIITSLQTEDARNSTIAALYNYFYPNGKGLNLKKYRTPINALIGALNENQDYDKLAKSFADKNNPIYQLFSDEVIDQMIQNANEYFQEAERIEDEEDQIYQKYRDGLLNNAKATGDAYNSLSVATQSGITQMINSFDYSDMTTEKFSDMATDLKDFVGKLSSDDVLRSYFDNLFNPATDDESIETYSTRVKQGIDDLSDYCKKHYPAINLDFGDFERDIEKLQEKYNDAISRFRGEGIRKQLESYNKDDTIDFTVRPVIDTSKLTAKGWEDAGDGTATVFSSTYYSEDFGLEEGKAIVVTPILPDGNVLAPAELEEYARKILSGENIDVDIKMGMFDGGNYKADADEFANKIHELHEKYFLDNDNVNFESFFVDNSINTEEEIDYFNKVTQSAKTAAEAIEMYNKAKVGTSDSTVKSISAQIESIQGLTDGFEIMDKIYADIKDGESFDYGNLADKDFIETFSAYEEEYNNFITTVSASPRDINACQSAFNNLITAWIDGKNALGQLNSANKQVTIDYLTNMGVTNAAEVVNAKYAKSIFLAKTESEEFQKVAKSEGATLDTLAESVTYTEEEQNELIAAHPELRNQFKQTDAGIKLSKSGYETLGLTVKNLSVLQKEEQLKQTQAVMDGVSDRISQYKLELSAIQSLATALSAINSTSINSAVYASTDYQDYLSMVEENPALMIDDKVLTKAEYDINKKQLSAGVQYGIDVEKLAKAQEKMANLDVGIKYEKTKDSGSGSSSKDKKEYEDTREYSDLYDEILSQYEKEIDQIEKANETLQYKYEQALEKGDFDAADEYLELLTTNKEKIQQIREAAAAELRETASGEMMPQIIDLASQFGFDLSGRTIDEISDVEIEQIRQALQEEINKQKRIGVDMENAGTGDNAYNIKTAELQLDMFEQIVSSLQNYYTAVGHINGEGEMSLEWLKTQNEMLEDKREYMEAISEQYEKQTDYIEHQIDLQRNAFNGDDVSFDEIKKEYVQYDEIMTKAHDEAEQWRQWYRENTELSDEEIEQQEEIVNAQKTWWDAKKAQQDLDQEVIDRTIEGLEKQIDLLEREYEQQNLITDALEKKYDIQRQIREEQRDLTAEYEAAKDIFAVSGDDGTLLNEDDYNTLTRQLKSIDSEITSLYEDYRDAINALGEDEWYKQEEITNEFERQQEALLDQYEIAKKQLEVTKQRSKLENTIKNKNKRTLIGGKWVQTADLQAVYEERKNLIALEDEEYELKRQASENRQLDAMRSLSDATNTEAQAVQYRIDLIEDMTALERKALANELVNVQGMDNLIDGLNKSTLPKFKTVIDAIVANLGKLTNVDTSSVGSTKSVGEIFITPSGDVDGSKNDNGFDIEWTPYYHTGRVADLKPDEEEAILLKNETVLTHDQAKNVANRLLSAEDGAELIPYSIAPDILEKFKGIDVSTLYPSYSLPTIPTTTTNNHTENQTIHIDNVIVKEPVQDIDSLLRGVIQQASLYHQRTKNIR